MPITQSPSVGRIVHYSYPVSAPDEPPCAAIIVGVAPAGIVDLNVFSSAGPPEIKKGVPCSMTEEPQPGHWNWPPRV